MKFVFTLFFCCISLGIFGFLLLHDIDPDGTFLVKHELGSRSPFVDRFLPDARVLVQEDDSVRVLEEPIYLSVHLPRTAYEFLDVRVYFRPNAQAVLELGALRDIFSAAYALRPLYHSFLEELSWSRLEDDGVVLYQRVKQFSSVEDFFATVPERTSVATYHFDLPTTFRLAEYRPLGGEREFSVSLRGYHRFVTYIKNEPLQLSVETMDMNRTAGRDDVVFIVRNELKEEVFREEWKDDGNVDEDQVSSTRVFSIDVPNLPEGVYTVELVGTSDIFWRVFRTNLRYMSFINQLYMADDVGYSAEAREAEFFTNVKSASFETFHADAPASVRIGAREVSVPVTHELVREDFVYSGIARGYLPKGGMRIIGEGKFAFSEESFFDPDPYKIPARAEVDLSGIDYVLTTYTPVDREGDWFVQSVRFDLSEVQILEGSTRFLLSAPFVFDRAEKPEVRALHLQFLKSPLSFSDVLRAARERLPFGL